MNQTITQVSNVNVESTIQLEGVSYCHYCGAVYDPSDLEDGVDNGFCQDCVDQMGTSEQS
jgi:hypothetical protein